MSLIGNDISLKGTLAWKGERGYSAYEIAVQNGFIGTEQDWLAQIGQSSHFSEDSIIHTATEGQTSFELPTNYTSNSFIDVYINGFRLNSSEYTINTTTQKINLEGITLEEGTVVEIIVLTMATNNLPIVTTINNASTDDTTPSTKAVYNYFQDFINTIYPIGSIYMTTNSIDPSSLFGGTWTQKQSENTTEYKWERTA